MTSSGARQVKRVPFDFLDLWICWSVWCVVVGWTLSAIGSLNSAGYGVALIGSTACVYVLRHKLKVTGYRHLKLRFGTNRGKIAPKLWAALTLPALIGGVFYHPSNYDYLTYRFPRVLYWAGENHWYWISTVNGRINISATGMEWLMVPLFSLFHTDRLFFLINAISYLLLPGIVFSVFRQLGIARRMAWWWMWVIPCGYCFVVQAASAGNDCFAATYALACIYYILKARVEPSAKNLALSTLSAALLTGAKLSNIPLLLPWAIAVLAARHSVYLNRRSPVLFLGVFLALGVSAMPTAMLNIHFAGDYTGDPQNQSGMRISNPVSGIYGNALQLATDNLASPAWPREISWETWLPQWLRQRLLVDFPRLDLHAGELQIEEEAGVGLGIVILLVVTAVGALVEPGGLSRKKQVTSLCVAAGIFVSFGAFMAKMGSESTSRLLAAYYPLLIAALLVVFDPRSKMTRRIHFRVFALIAMVSALPLVILNPARPLFPVAFTFRLLARAHVSPAIIDRFNRVYGVYANRFDAFRLLDANIPATEKVVGLIQRGDDPIASLWRPFGARKILEIPSVSSPDALRSAHIRYVVVSQDALEYFHGPTIDQLTSTWGARLIDAPSLVLKVKNGPEKWYVVALPP